MHIVPVKQKVARMFIKAHHRHLPSTVGDLFRVGLKKGTKLIGVCLVGRPVSRALAHWSVCEVSRLCVIEGHKNGCSMLLGAACRIAKEMGYRRIYTYTLPEEGGSSLRGAGWDIDGITKGGYSWNCSKREYGNKKIQKQKIRWKKDLNRKRKGKR